MERTGDLVAILSSLEPRDILFIDEIHRMPMDPAFGVTIHIILSAFINISMVVGLLPIVGIPLPLMSYGLSNLWVVLASLGLFNGIAMRRFEIRS